MYLTMLGQLARDAGVQERGAIDSHTQSDTNTHTNSLTETERDIHTHTHTNTY